MASDYIKSAEKTAAKQFHKPGRRARVPLSCDPCRSRKLKCNREQPCQNCTARFEQETCKYRGSKNGPGSGISRRHENEDADPMQERINRLESLVKTLVAQSQEKSQSEDSSPSKSAGSSPDNHRLGNGYDMAAGTKNEPVLSFNAGTTLINERQSVYKTANDWSDVLQEIDELKKVWNQTQDDPADYDVQRNISLEADGSSFLSGQVKHIEMSELLASLPPKPDLDFMIQQFFDRASFGIPVAPIIHEPSFMRQYAEHRKDPSRTNVMWLGLLFSILGVTMLSYRQQDDEPSQFEGVTDTLFDLYRLRTAQCMMIGDIAKCLPYTLETLLFNSTAELGRKDDSGRGLWMMTGVIVRTAINMGYHREPSQTSSISILQGEMRRRVWLAIVGKDDLASFLVGFPTMMPAVYSDTLEPRNLHDWELSADMTVLPPSRSMAESTPVTYLLAKSRLMRALGRVADFNNALTPGSYEQLLEVDNFLRETYEKIPSHMKVQGWNNNNKSSDPSFSSQSKSATVVATHQMEFLYHRGMCSLHRKFLAKGRLENRYSLSHDRCISSALAILAQQQAFHAFGLSKSSAPHWYKVAHARQFIIIAAMIICLDLEHRRRGINIDKKPDKSVLINELEKSCKIWKDVQDTSDESRRVYQVLKGMLLSFETPISENGISYPQTEQVATEVPAAKQAFQTTNGAGLVFLEEDLFTTSSEMDIDWATWDSFVEGVNFEDPYQAIPFNDADFNYNTRLDSYPEAFTHSASG